MALHSGVQGLVTPAGEEIQTLPQGVYSLTYRQFLSRGMLAAVGEGQGNEELCTIPSSTWLPGPRFPDLPNADMKLPISLGN